MSKIEEKPVVSAAQQALDLVEIGDVVYWYTDGDEHAKPQPAFVTDIGYNALTLNILGPDLRSFRVVTGSHHISDPNCRRIETREDGGWDHTPRMKKLFALLEGFA